MLIHFLDIVLQPNAETDDSITPLASAVAAGSLACLELLIQVYIFVHVQYNMEFVPKLCTCIGDKMKYIFVMNGAQFLFRGLWRGY